jgi:hypothetical protein
MVLEAQNANVCEFLLKCDSSFGRTFNSSPVHAIPNNFRYPYDLN